MTGAQTPSTWTFRIAGKLRPVHITPHVFVNSFQVLCAVAASGMGLVQAPILFAAEAIAARKLRQVLAEYAPPASPLFAVYPSARNVSPALHAMVEILVEHFPNLAP